VLYILRVGGVSKMGQFTEKFKKEWRKEVKKRKKQTAKAYNKQVNNWLAKYNIDIDKLEDIEIKTKKPMRKVLTWKVDKNGKIS